MTDANEAQRKAWLRELTEAADNTPEAQRKRAIEALGERWICHPANAPQRGTYNPLTGAKV
ncbi:MAG TPA: hypothetical protein VF534_17845 [Paraburkholderia sp.]